MQNLQITNSHFITYQDDTFTIDILGGVDDKQLERMVVTLRITHQQYPPCRSTLDLYHDQQTKNLIRTLCDKWELKLLAVSVCIDKLTLQLENYRLQALKFTSHNNLAEPSLTDAQRAAAKNFLMQPDLIAQLTTKLNTTGILGEEENSIILFLALASYKYNNPFSVLCMAKNGMGKSYLLQKLMDCMPNNSFSFHTRISDNALYYFDSSMIQGKALIIEDIEWTTAMLQPLATLQTQGRIVNTKATKDKDGKLHSTSSEVAANLCLIACTYATKGIDESSLPFLCINLNHSPLQDIAIMEYQKQCKAGLIQTDTIRAVQKELKNVLTTLQNTSIINPFATLINLPKEINYPRKSLLLVLNFIEVITYFFQYQREQIVNTNTGEVFIKTHPQDIAVAFDLLKPILFKRADELSSAARTFYNWLIEHLKDSNEFTALDIRKINTIHPRTLNNYLQELKYFGYIQITGGNKHRGGFIYTLTDLDNQSNIQGSIEKDLNDTLQKIWKAYNETNKEENKDIIKLEEPPKPEEEIIIPAIKEEARGKKRIRIEEKEAYTLQLLMGLEAEQNGRQYTPEDITTISGRSRSTEARYLKTLWERNILNRVFKDNQYYYTIASTTPKNSTEPSTSTVAMHTS
jgi:predicted transcriptional regulator